MRRIAVIPLVLSALLVAGCSSEQSDPTTTATTAPATSTTTGADIPVTTTPGTTVTTVNPLYDHFVGTETFTSELTLDIHASPDLESGAPVFVMFHGGGWYGGNKDSMGYLADGLADRGGIVFNATYRTVADGGRFPGTVEDIACAVAYASDNAGRFVAQPGPVVIVGHSAGAHLSALVAFSPDTFVADDCVSPTAALPDGFVGLAGPYNSDLFTFILSPFFGTDYADDPTPWTAGNPLTYVSDEIPPVLLLHGDADEVVPLSLSEQLADAITIAGGEVAFEVLPRAGHGEVNAPQVTADRIIEFAAGLPG